MFPLIVQVIGCGVVLVALFGLLLPYAKPRRITVGWFWITVRVLLFVFYLALFFGGMLIFAAGIQFAVTEGIREHPR